MIRALAALIVLTAGAMGPIAVGAPSRECVETLRRARIAEMRGETADALGHLVYGAAHCPETDRPVAALLDFRERHALGAGHEWVLRAALIARVGDPRSRLARGTLRFLVDESGIDDEEIEELLSALERRLTPEADDTTALEATMLLQLRLGRAAEARATLDQLLALRPTATFVRRAAELDRHLGPGKGAAGFPEDYRSGGNAITYSRKSASSSAGDTP